MKYWPEMILTLNEIIQEMPFWNRMDRYELTHKHLNKQKIKLDNWPKSHW